MSIQAAEELVQALTRMADANENDGLREELWNLDANGFSLLHYICMYGYKSLTPVVLDCIRRGDNGEQTLLQAVNKPTRNGIYPLHLAASSGSEELVKNLIAAGADLLHGDTHGNLASSYCSNLFLREMLLAQEKGAVEPGMPGGAHAHAPVQRTTQQWGGPSTHILKSSMVALNYDTTNNSSFPSSDFSMLGSSFVVTLPGPAVAGNLVHVPHPRGGLVCIRVPPGGSMGVKVIVFGKPRIPMSSGKPSRAMSKTGKEHDEQFYLRARLVTDPNMDLSQFTGEHSVQAADPSGPRYAWTLGSVSSSVRSASSGVVGASVDAGVGVGGVSSAGNGGVSNVGVGGSSISGRSGISGSSSSSSSSSSSNNNNGGHYGSGSSSGSISPRSPSPGLQAASDSLQRDLLLGAFKTLSLHDRVALSIGLESRSSENPGSPEQTWHNDDQMTDSGSEYFSDTSSMVSEADVVDALRGDMGSDSIYAAMSAMNPSEQAIVREQISLIQSNVKAWLVRRNFKNMCNATHVLQRRLRGKIVRHKLQRLKSATKTIENRRLAALTRRRFVSIGKAVTALQAAHRGSAERKQFKEIREQVSAALIMNRNPAVVCWPLSSSTLLSNEEGRLKGIAEEDDL